MKIAIFLDRFEAGGVETHVLTLSKEFLRRGHEVLIYTNAVSRKNIQYLSDGHPLFQYKLWAGNLEETIASFDPDIIHAHPFQSMSKGFKISKALNKPFFITSHGQYPIGLDRSSRGRLKCAQVKRVLAVDRRVEAYLEKELSCPEKIVLMPNGIDLEYFHPTVASSEEKINLGLNPDWFTIIYVSRLEDGKQRPVHQLFQNTARIAEFFNGLNIVIVGGGSHYSSVELKAKEIKENTPKVNITTVGHQFDTRKFVAAADLVIGVGRSALEAQAMQKPVLCAYASGFKGLLNRENYAKFLYRHVSYPLLAEEELLELFKQIAAGQLDLKSMAADFFKIIQENHDIKNIATKHEQLYEGCL